MPTKDVILKVNTDTKQAEKGFQNIESESNKAVVAIEGMNKGLVDIPKNTVPAAAGLTNLSAIMNKAQYTNQSFNRILQDSPYFFQSFNMGIMSVSNNIPTLFEAFARLKAETGSTKLALKSFLGTFIGPQGFLSIINLAVSAGLALSMYFQNQAREAKKAADEIDHMAEAVKGFVNVKSQLDEKELRFQAENLKQYIPEQETLLKSLQKEFDAVKQGWLLSVRAQDDVSTKVLADRMNSLTEEISVRTKVIEKLKEESKQYQELGKVAKIYSEFIQDRKDKEKSKMGWVDFLGEDAEWFEDEILSKDEGLGFNPRYKMKPTGKKPDLPKVTEEEARKAFREFDIIANESARTLYSVFSEAWRDIFGEANSIFEQLLQNISMGLMDAFAQDASSSIFNALIPGGSLFSGLSGGQANNSTVLVQIGENELTKATAKSVQSTYGEMQRRRIL